MNSEMSSCDRLFARFKRLHSPYQRACAIPERTPRRYRSNTVGVFSIVKSELFFGSLRSQNPVKSRQAQDDFFRDLISLPFDDIAAEYYARIRADLTNHGLLIGPNDLQIAAIALANNLILVTHNTGEFERVTGLRLEDWELPSQP